MTKRIMIVDDDSDLLIFLRTLFEHENFEVFTVDSGNDCIEELERGFNGIILMDLMMPFKDGWSTIQEIVKKGLAKHAIISIITASGRADPGKMKGLEQYIHDYIQKPFDLEKLVLKVNTTAMSTQSLSYYQNERKN